MAWVTEYDMTWRGLKGAWGYIYLQRDEGVYQNSLYLLGEGMQISRSFPSWEDHVARTNCTFTIATNDDDFYALVNLMTAVAGQVRVLVTNESASSVPIIMFEGFLNVETVNRKMLKYSNLTLTASGLLNKLQYVHPTSIDVLQYMTLIDIIDDCLSLTGTAHPIYVQCSLYEYNSALSAGQTLFNRIGIYTEAFWKNNIERKSALEILESILASANCYLYWHEEAWYIMHYQDFNQDRDFVIYTGGTSAGYGYADTGTTEAYAVERQNIHDNALMHQVGDTQDFQVIPGKKQVDVKMNQKEFFNLLNPDLTESSDTATAEPLLVKREWLSYELGSPFQWSDRGQRWQDIDNSIRRFSHDIVSGSLQLNGLTTRFTTSTNGFDTMLIITFKFAVSSIAHLGSWMDETEFKDNPEATTITFYWYLATYESIIANRDFVWYNDTTEEYELVLDGDEQTEYNTLEITAADLDPDFLTYTGTIKIPIGTVFSSSSGDSDDLDLVFRMGTELVDKTGETAAPAHVVYYGDFKASISGPAEDNFLQGVVTTDFLDKITIEMDMFDAGWNYRNSLVRPTSFIYLTDLWGYGDTGYSLADWMMMIKFRLYRISRQKIVMDTIDDGLSIYPLGTPWLDDKQSNKVFIQLSEVFYPQRNTHRIQLYEFDDTEDITLI